MEISKALQEGRDISICSDCADKMRAKREI